MADTAAEAALARRVAEILPGAAVVGEEAVSADKRVLDRIGQADLAVIIDPVDGTWNFAHGLATFGVILAVIHRGETVFGLLYDPVFDDWVAAERGGGCWFGRPGGARTPLSLPSGPPSRIGFLPFYMFAPEVQTRLGARLPEFERSLSLRCSCHEYRTLAQGGVGFSVAAGLMPWDHAAGALCIAEAGGTVLRLDGTPYAPTQTQGVMVAASHAEVADWVAALLREVGA